MLLRYGCWDRNLLQKLYEDWLSAQGDWSKTATYMDAKEQFNSTKRGRYVYKAFKELVATYGLPIAKEIRAKKQEAEKARDPAGDEEPFWLAHPEVPNDEEIGLVWPFLAWSELRKSVINVSPELLSHLCMSHLLSHSIAALQLFFPLEKLTSIYYIYNIAMPYSLPYCCYISLP